MFRKDIRKLNTAVLLAGLLISQPVTSFATPSAFMKQALDTKNVTPLVTGEYSDEDNPTGLERKTGESLKENIEKLLPYLEDMLASVYERIEEDFKNEIRENGWDAEYSLTSFYEYGNPYKDVDYNALIAAYCTIVELGRNDAPLLSDVPFIRMETTDTPIDETHSYAEVSMKVLDTAGLFRYYGYDPNDEDVREIYRKRLSKIEEALKDTDVREQVFILTPEELKIRMENATTLGDYEIPENTPENIRYVLAAALSLRGKVPYDWGGKPSKPGYDTSWWTYNGETGRQKGLDCSGLVSWAFMTAGYPKEVTDQMLSTYAIRQNLEDIGADELEPGDIGLMKNDSEGTNHTGIYLGNGQWVHCSSAGHTVVTGEYGFRYFKKAPEADIDLNVAAEYFQDPDASENRSNPMEIPATDNEVYTLAQLIEHEEGIEGYNNWVAVAEVVANRVRSTGFPDSVLEVIYQPHQFSYVEEIASITPRPEVIEVAREVLHGDIRYFNNPHVLFFRNTQITDGFPSSTPVDWGKLPWYTSVGLTAFYLEAGDSIPDD